MSRFELPIEQHPEINKDARIGTPNAWSEARQHLEFVRRYFPDDDAGIYALLFEVGGSFPRLTKSELTSGTLMPGVSGIQYEVDLGGLQSTAVADEPHAASVPLRRLLE